MFPVRVASSRMDTLETVGSVHEVGLTTRAKLGRRGVGRGTAGRAARTLGLGCEFGKPQTWKLPRRDAMECDVMPRHKKDATVGNDDPDLYAEVRDESFHESLDRRIGVVEGATAGA